MDENVVQVEREVSPVMQGDFPPLQQVMAFMEPEGIVHVKLALARLDATMRAEESRQKDEEITRLRLALIGPSATGAVEADTPG